MSRKAARERAREHLLIIRESHGSSCLVCGSTEWLEFHHEHPGKKFCLSGSELTRSWTSILAELRKCILVCNKCHKALGNGIYSVTL